MIPLNFIFSGPFSAETREKCYCQSIINDFGFAYEESMSVRIIGKNFELSPVLDRDVFPEYYAIAYQHVNKMKEGL